MALAPAALGLSALLLEPVRPYQGPDAVDATAADEPAATSPVAPAQSPPAESERHRAHEEPVREEPVRGPIEAEPAMLRPSLLGEVDFRGISDDAEGKTGFAVGRFRMGLRFQPRPWFMAVGNAEWVGDAPYLLDGYALFRPARWVELGVGYAKPPLFPSFRHEPVVLLPTPDRSPVVTGFRVRRDVGAEVRLTPERAPIEAIVRIGNGQTGLANDNATPAGYGALDLVLGRAWRGGRVRKVGLRLGAAGLVDHAAPHAGVSGQNAVGYAFFPGPPIRGLRVVGEAHAIGYAGPVRATVEAAMARETVAVDHDGDPDTPTIEGDLMDSYGITGELACVVLGRPRAVGHAPAPRNRDGWSGGALEIAGRVDRIALARATPHAAPGGATGGVLAIKWFATEFLAAAIAGNVIRYDVPPIDSPGRTLGWSIIARLSAWWTPSASPKSRPRKRWKR